jgi:hypothetical protein
MLHWLKRHPIPVSAHFRHALVLTYAFPPDVLAPLLPARLALDTWRGSGFLAIALVAAQRMRPSFLPSALGQDFFLGGYRIFARLAGAESLRGLWILRSATDRRLMVRAGNLLTHYNYSLCRAKLDERHSEIRWMVQSPDGDADLDVIARGLGTDAVLPPGSPFTSLAEARRFAGPLPYTFDDEAETGAIIAVRAMRQEWNPRPVAVEVRRCTFLEREPFCRATPILANAFHVPDVDYKWLRGRRVA